MAGVPTEYLVAAGLAFVAILMLGIGGFVFVNPFRSTRDRLEELTSTNYGEAPATSNPLSGPATGGQVDVLRKTVAKVAAPQADDELDALKRRLNQAGFRSRNNVELFSSIRFGLAVLLPTIYALILPKGTSLSTAAAVAIVIASAGYYVPGVWVTNTLLKRQEGLLRTFPDALDMLVASVEAGLGLDAALKRVSEEMDDGASELANELRMVTNEVNAGVPRDKALIHLGERTGVDEITSLANVLVQANRFGTPVARSLRVHAGMVRTRRMQRAEEAAAKISPKLTVAMIMFMLPCLILILLGPAIVRMVRTLLPALAG